MLNINLTIDNGFSEEELKNIIEIYSKVWSYRIAAIKDTAILCEVNNVYSEGDGHLYSSIMSEFFKHSKELYKPYEYKYPMFMASDPHTDISISHIHKDGYHIYAIWNKKSDKSCICDFIHNIFGVEDGYCIAMEWFKMASSNLSEEVFENP